MHRSQIQADALSAFLSACSEQSIVLNSERIEQRFGSYGIRVLSNESGLRRSSLESYHDSAATCRTYAVVEFVDRGSESLGHAHARILAGDSIGATLKELGWEVRKESLLIAEVGLPDAPTEIRRLMRLEGSHKVALHAYRLTAASQDEELAYATILEAHHPEYLGIAGLQEIYGQSRAPQTPTGDLTQFTDLLFGR